MHLPSFVALFSSLTAGVCAVLLAHRAANRRIRHLALSVALLAICQGLLLLPDALGSGVFRNQYSEEIIHLSAGLLSLAVVHFLKRENRDRRNLDVQVRCYEAEKPAGDAPVDLHPAAPAESSGAERRRARRYRLASPCLLTSSAAPQQPARVVNISRTGICLASASATALTEHVEIELFGQTLTGTVVRCRWANQEYEYGVELQPVLRTTELSTLLRCCLEHSAQPVKA